MARKTFALLCTSCSLSQLGVPVLSHSSPGHFMLGLLQHGLYGATLEGNSEATAVAEGSLVDNSWSP